MNRSIILCLQSKSKLEKKSALRVNSCIFKPQALAYYNLCASMQAALVSLASLTTESELRGLGLCIAILKK